MINAFITTSKNILQYAKRPLLAVVVTGMCSGLYTITLPNYYISTVKLLPVDSRAPGGIGGIAGAAATLGITVPTPEGSESNYIDILNSRWLRERLLKTEVQYRFRSWYFGDERNVNGTLAEYLRAKNIDQGMSSLGQILSASRDIKSRVITISAETCSPELSQQVVQHAAKQLEIFLQEKGHTHGGSKARFADSRLIEARQVMSDAEKTLLEFLEFNRNYHTSTDPKIKLWGARLEAELRLQQQLVSSISIYREQALLEEENDIPILNVLDPGNLPINKSRPGRAQLVMISMFIIGVGAWCVENRQWILKRVFS